MAKIVLQMGLLKKSSFLATSRSEKSVQITLPLIFLEILVGNHSHRQMSNSNHGQRRVRKMAISQEIDAQHAPKPASRLDCSDPSHQKSGQGTSSHLSRERVSPCLNHRVLEAQNWTYSKSEFINSPRTDRHITQWKTPPNDKKRHVHDESNQTTPRDRRPIDPIDCHYRAFRLRLRHFRVHQLE